MDPWNGARMDGWVTDSKYNVLIMEPGNGVSAVTLVYNKIEDDIPGHVVNKHVVDLHAFWSSELRDRVLSDVQATCRERLSFIWPRLMILKREGDDFRYLHYGERISVAAGFDMQGKRASDFKSGVGTFFCEVYLECLAKQKPIYTTHHAEHAANVKSWERLMVPTVDEDGAQYIICYNQPLERKSLLFDALMEANLDGVAIYRPKFSDTGELIDMIFHMVNRHVCDTFGLKETEIIGRGLCELFPGAERESLPHYAEMIKTGMPCEFERTHDLPGGRKHLLFKATVVQDRVVTVATDITELRNAQQTADRLLRKSNRTQSMLKTLIDVLPIPIFRRDSDGRFDLLNDAFAEIVGAPAEDLRGKMLEEVYDAPSVANIRDEDAELIAKPGSTQTTECSVKALHSETARDVVFYKTSMVLDGDSVPSIVGAAVDVTEQNALRTELEWLAHTDPLTGIANRRRFMSALEDEIERSITDDRQVSLILIDIDHFKHINDTHGHALGDTVIKGIAEMINQAAEAAEGLAARIGGEEYAVIMPDCGARAALTFAERLRKSVAGNVISHEDEDISVTISLGIASGLDGADDVNADTLLIPADIALYESKARGRNRTSLHGEQKARLTG